MDKDTKPKRKPRSQMRPRSADTKDRLLGVRFSRAEIEILKLMADTANVSVSGFIRARALGTCLPKIKLQWNARINGGLGKIGNNLNQIVGHAVKLGNVTIADEVRLRISGIAELAGDISDDKLAAPLDGGASFIDPLRQLGQLLNTGARRLNNNPPNEALLDRATEFLPSLDAILEGIKNAGRV